MTLAVVITFLNEERCLERTLESVAAQTRPPDRLLLVDDGSTDSSPQIAAAFAAWHDWAELLRLPPRPPAPDRLARAYELRAFKEGVRLIGEEADVIAKLDADIGLTPRTFETLLERLSSDELLGIAGAFLSVDEGGLLVRERCPPDHVRGATKFYRRECLEAIAPIPEILGWDTIDEVRARLAGWSVRTFEMPDGDPLHMRPTGAFDGLVRGFSRRGICAWSYGAHPAAVALGAVSRMKDRPRVIGGLAYFGGWARAAARRLPRAEPEVRAAVRREQLQRIRRRGAATAPPPPR